MPRPDPERFGSLDWGQTNLGQPSQPNAACFESQLFSKAAGQLDREKATKIFGSVACLASFQILHAVCRDVLLKLQVGTDDTRRPVLFSCSNESLEDILVVPPRLCEASG